MMHEKTCFYIIVLAIVIIVAVDRLSSQTMLAQLISGTLVMAFMAMVGITCLHLRSSDRELL